MEIQTQEEKESIKQRVREQTVGYIATALGLVAGLAWNEAIKDLINSIYPSGGGLGAKFIYAIVITIAIVVVSSYLLRFSQKKKD